jgi:hypothetical protein
MKKNMLSKTLVVGIVVLFLGANFVSANSINVESTNVIDDIKKPSRDTKTFYPIEDSYIAHGYPNDNAGDAPHFKIKNEYGASAGYECSALLKFDISSLPKGSVINSAVLYLFYFTWLDTNPAGRMLNVYSITSNWNEDTVTWNTAPTYNPAASAYSPVPATVNVWMDWDVTVDVQDFVNGNKDNYGWKISDDNYWGTYDIPESRFRTKEYGTLTPHLVVNYKKAREFNSPLLNFLQSHPNLFPLLQKLLQNLGL